MSVTLIPAVDVVNGKAVRLDRGEAGTEKTYGEPLEAAQEWQDRGAEWLHFVDLDAAFGRGSNYELMAEITRSLRIPVELTGGLRDEETLLRALETGAQRVNIGTAALRDPEWTVQMIRRHGSRIAVDLGAVNEAGEWRVKGNGWVTDGGDLWEVLERFDAAGCSRFVVTDVSRDGTLSGPNVQLLREVAAATDAAVTASGGISSLADIRAVAEFATEGIDAVIVGKALYEKRFSLEEAIAAAAGNDPERG